MTSMTRVSINLSAHPPLLPSRKLSLREVLRGKSNYLIIHCRRHPVITVSVIFILLSVLTFMLLTCAATCILDPGYYIPLSKQNNDLPYRVILYGDSLITGNHKQNFGLFPLLSARISSFLPHYNLDIMNFGHAGDGIDAMRQRLSHVLATPADAVVLLWDSDVSAINETPDTFQYLRQVYISNLTHIIETIQRNKTGVRIAIAGPGILGEGPLFKSVSYNVYHEKKILLNKYRAINQQVAAAFNISYIDIRLAYLEALPSYRLAYSGCLTVDGEHENDNGLRIISKLIAQAVFDWIDA